MALDGNVVGNTELQETKQDLISEMVQRELKASMRIMPFITDVSMFATKGAKSISFPKLGSFTAGDRASGQRGTPQTLAATVDQLSLDKRKYISWIVDPNDEIQSTIDFQAAAAGRAARAHGYQVESDCLTELEATASLNVLGAAPAAIDQDNILAMRQWLLENEANMNQLVMYASPDQETALLKIADFVRADSYGGSVSGLASGVIGRVYGVPVVISNVVKAQQAFMFDKDALAIGFQRRPAFDEQKEIEFGVGALLQATEQLYGVKAMQIDAAVEKNTIPVGTSPLIAKLID